MDLKKTGILGGCILAAALVHSLIPQSMRAFGAGPETGSVGPGPAMRVHSADGDLVVDYNLQSSPTSSAGTKIEGVSDIEFYDRYVVVKTKEGGGMLFFHMQTSKLHWRLAKRGS
jgi:hypothetical protein